MYQKDQKSYSDDAEGCLIEILTHLVITALVVYAIVKLFI